MNKNLEQLLFESKKVLLVIFGITIVLCLFIRTVYAKVPETNRVKVVKTIQVQKDDCLWSIASKYYTTEYKDMNIYIDEIKRANGLSTDIIHTGSFIILPFYEDPL